MKKYITTDGKTARPVNPYAEFTWDGQHHGLNNEFIEFEKSIKRYPIHSPNPIKGEFWGEVTREAVQPVPVKGEENDLVGNVIEIPEINITPPSELTELTKAVWNSAIDACTDAANRLPYEPFLLIDRLKSLRK